MSTERDKQFAALKHQLNYQADFIAEFLAKLKKGEIESNFLVFEFQSLMDGLIPIKEKADRLTRILDHG